MVYVTVAGASAAWKTACCQGIVQKYARNVISLTFKHMNTARENIQMSNK